MSTSQNSMTVLSRPVRKGASLFNSLALMLFSLSNAELLGFPRAARHLKICSATYIHSRLKPGNKFYSLQWNSNAFAWFWSSSILGRWALSKQFCWTNKTSLGSMALSSTSAGLFVWVVQVVDRGPTQILDDERREKLSKKGTLQWVSSSFVNSSKKSCQIWVTPELPRDLEQENALPRQEGQRGEITSKLFQTKIDS